MANLYNKLRKNASLGMLAATAKTDANRLRRELEAYRGTLTTGALLSYEQHSKLRTLAEAWEKAFDLAKHLDRLSQR